MKRTAVLILIVHYITISDSRLIKKGPEPTPASTTSTNASPARVRRFPAYEDSVASDSRGDQSNESAFHEKNTNLLKKKPQLVKKRVTRNSNATVIDASKVQSSSVNEVKVLVKKPIPKFSEDDYDLDPKGYRLLPRFVETDELEDEDFNVDDYDFDLKHDEYAGREKPSVPRLKKQEKILTEAPTELKITRETNPDKDQQTLENTSKPPVASSKQKSTHKGAEKSKDKKDEFYDYEITTKNVEKEKAEEGSEETEESKEFERSQASRRVRSPWHEIMLPTKVIVKSASSVPKHIAVLPMFPIRPASKTSNPE